jgi:hypothetical protein
MRTCAKLAVCLAVCSWAPALAVAEPEPALDGVTVALAIGYAREFGDLAKKNSLGYSYFNQFSWGQFPLSLGIGYRPTPRVSFGAVLVYAPLAVANGFGDYSGTDVRIGGEIRLHIMPRQSASPWVSLGVDYESLRFASEDAYWDERFSGYDLTIQVGGDFRSTSFLTLGPYLGLSVGRYGTYGGSCASRGCTYRYYDLPDSDRTIHAWLAFGLRGVFTFFSR